jgi:hypothetical protein
MSTYLTSVTQLASSLCPCGAVPSVFWVTRLEAVHKTGKGMFMGSVMATTSVMADTDLKC